MKKTLPLLLFLIGSIPANAQWNSNPGINNVVSNRIGAEYDPISISDGANGSILFFSDYTNNGDIFAQKITSFSTIAWGSTSSPVPIATSTGEKYELKAIADGSGGTFVAWSDYRHDPLVGEIYLQKLNSAGVAQWVANGLRVTNNTAQDDLFPQLCLDGAGGVIVAWYGDDSLTENIQAYAQRFNSSGIAQWAAAGVQLSTAGGFRAPTGIVADGSNGAIILMLDTRNDPNGFDYDYLDDNDLTNTDIYGQRLNAAGARQWTNNGAAIITAANNQSAELAGSAISDGSGGIIVVFDDARNDDGSETNTDLFAQRVNGSGVPLWASNGVAVCTAAGNQYLTGIVSDGAGGVVASIDYEDISRLYAQRITAAGAASWPVNGVPVSQASDQISDASLTTDGSGNTIFAFRSFNTNLLKAQKLNNAGAQQWPAAGAIICNNEFSFANYPTIVSSDAGSAILSWSDSRNLISGSDQDIFASKILTNGTLAGNAVSGYVTIANGSWNNPATWSGGIVPPAGAIVNIRHIVVGNINTSCSFLNILPGGNLTVNTGISISIPN